MDGLIWGVVGLVGGGVLKGAIGAGSPVLGVPILALIYDVPFAVAIFTFPNLVSNLWQGWAYRAEQLGRGFVWRFAGAGAAGALVGSFMLALLPGEALMASLATFVFFYIALRLARPGWTLSRPAGDRFALPIGLLGGIMQGAGGISAPVSVTFLNAMRLERGAFIATISVFFTAMTVVQIPTLWSLGILTGERLALSLAAVVPLFAGIALGTWLARFVSKALFDKLILGLLAVIALRLLYAAFAG